MAYEILWLLGFRPVLFQSLTDEKKKYLTDLQFEKKKKKKKKKSKKKPTKKKKKKKKNILCMPLPLLAIIIHWTGFITQLHAGQHYQH